ncbi:hypothetical protein Hanom_Chr14g01333001 [Helianthus anomalus]
MLIQMLRSLFGRSLWFFAYGLQVYVGSTDGRECGVEMWLWWC